MDEPDKNAEISVNTSLRKAESVRVTYLDDSIEDIDVIMVPITLMGEYINQAGNMPRLVMLCCNKDEVWFNRLTDESAYELDERARAINDPRVSHWLDRQLVAIKGLAPMKEKVNQLKSDSTK